MFARSTDRGRRGPITALAVAFVGATGFAVLAQGDAPTAPNEADVVTPAAADPTTSEGRLAAAERAVANGHTVQRALENRLATANGRNDIVMIDCLSPLRTELEATLASADSRLRALRLLAQSGDEAAAEHEYTMVMVASQRIAIVDSDMNRCLGDADIAAGEDQVTVEVTVDLPDEDPAVTPTPAAPPAPPPVPPPLSPAF